MRARCTDAAPGDWNDLVASDPTATPAHRPELWRAVAAVLPGFDLRFVAIESGDALVGGVPLMIQRRAGLAWLRALPFLLSGAPLARGALRAEVDRATGGALAALQREECVVGGEWACYRSGGEGVAAESLERLDGETRWFESSIIDLSSGLDAAFGTMDRKTRQGFAQSNAAGLRCVEDPGALESAVALHARQSRRWRGHHPVPLALSRRLIEDGVARLFTVRDGGGPLCAALVLEGAHEDMMWWSGAREESRAVGAYPLLAWTIAEGSHARGKLRLNLGASTGLGSVAGFKRSLGARPVRWPVRWMSARYAPPAGRLIAALEIRLRRLRARGEEA